MIKQIFKNLNLRTKFLVIGMTMTLVPLIIFGAIAFFNSRNLQEISRTESLKLAYTDLDHIASNVYAMAEAQQQLLEKSLLDYLNVARKIVTDKGGAGYEAERTAWQAVNQYTKASTRVDLPRYAVGKQWLGQITDPSEYVSVVDDLQELAPGVTCTVPAGCHRRIRHRGTVQRYPRFACRTGPFRFSAGRHQHADVLCG